MKKHCQQPAAKGSQPLLLLIVAELPGMPTLASTLVASNAPHAKTAKYKKNPAGTRDCNLIMLG